MPVVPAQMRRHAPVIHHLRQLLCGPDVRSHAQRPCSLPRYQYIVACDLQVHISVVSSNGLADMWLTDPQATPLPHR